MARWEYLEVLLEYDREAWVDSNGREGKLQRDAVWCHSGSLLNDLGREAWELAGVETYPYADTVTGYASQNRSRAKWIFKRRVGGKWPW